MTGTVTDADRITGTVMDPAPRGVRGKEESPGRTVTDPPRGLIGCSGKVTATEGVWEDVALKGIGTKHGARGVSVALYARDPYVVANGATTVLGTPGVDVLIPPIVAINGGRTRGTDEDLLMTGGLVYIVQISVAGTTLLGTTEVGMDIEPDVVTD